LFDSNLYSEIGLNFLSPQPTSVILFYSYFLYFTFNEDCDRIIQHIYNISVSNFSILLWILAASYQGNIESFFSILLFFYGFRLELLVSLPRHIIYIPSYRFSGFGICKLQACTIRGVKRLKRWRNSVVSFNKWNRKQFR
jgi:hypothetical protein